MRFSKRRKDYWPGIKTHDCPWKYRRDQIRIAKNSRDLLRLVESFGYGVHEIRHGQAGKALASASIPENYAATNVLCIANA